MSEPARILTPLQKKSTKVDSSWIERIRKNSFLKFFPELSDEILAAGEIRKYPAGVKIFRSEKAIDSIRMALNCNLSLRLSSGRLADDTLFSSIKPFETLGCEEAIAGRNFPFSIETESETPWCFQFPKTSFCDTSPSLKI
jgi:hypothetical protein